MTKTPNRPRPRRVGTSISGCEPYPVTIVLSPLELEAVQTAAGDGTVSAYARNAFSVAAGTMTDRDAATAAGLPLAVWRRLVLLESAGWTDLGRQLARLSEARKAPPK